MLWEKNDRCKDEFGKRHFQMKFMKSLNLGRPLRHWQRRQVEALLHSGSFQADSIHDLFVCLKQRRYFTVSSWTSGKEVRPSPYYSVPNTNAGIIISSLSTDGLTVFFEFGS